MNSVLHSSFVMAICFVSGCALVHPAGKEVPQKAKLILAYWDEGVGKNSIPAYESKMKVFIDGELAGESDSRDRYEKKRLTIAVDPGVHVMIIEGYAKTEREWEKRTKARGYSADHRLEKKIDIGAGEEITINFVVPDKAGDIKIQL